MIIHLKRLAIDLAHTLALTDIIAYNEFSDKVNKSMTFISFN